MGAPRDVVWDFMKPGSNSLRFTCTVFSHELHGNPTLLKKNIVGSNCSPPDHVERKLLQLLVQRTNRADRERLVDELGAMQPDGEPREKRLRADSAVGSSRARTGSLKCYVSALSYKEAQIIDAKRARWIYLSALPLSTTAEPGVHAPQPLCTCRHSSGAGVHSADDHGGVVRLEQCGRR